MSKPLNFINQLAKTISISSSLDSQLFSTKKKLINKLQDHLLKSDNKDLKDLWEHNQEIINAIEYNIDTIQILREQWNIEKREIYTINTRNKNITLEIQTNILQWSIKDKISIITIHKALINILQQQKDEIKNIKHLKDDIESVKHSRNTKHQSLINDSDEDDYWGLMSQRFSRDETKRTKRKSPINDSDENDFWGLMSQRFSKEY
jgi:hypothetical protein